MSALLTFVILQIVSRWVGWSIPQTEELTRYCLTTLTAFACYPWPVDAMSPKRSRDARLLARVLVLAVLAIALIGAVALADLGRGQRLSTLPVTVWWVYGAVVAALSVSFAALVLRTIAERNA